jgi:hypothetical protein
VIPAGGDGGGGDGLLPDLFGSSLGVPRSGDIKCSAQGAANLWAEASPAGPRVGDSDIAGSFLLGWATGTAVLYGSVKGAAGATVPGGAAVATGAGAPFAALAIPALAVTSGSSEETVAWIRHKLHHKAYDAFALGYWGLLLAGLAHVPWVGMLALPVMCLVVIRVFHFSFSSDESALERSADEAN